MAEYVRRRRPPASHPYWDRLNDRAHPPRLFLRIGIPTLTGLLFGLYSGLRSPFSISDAVHLAAICAAVLSTVAFVPVFLFMIFDRTGQFAPRDRWATAPLFSVMVAAFCLVIGFVASFILLFWYSLCAGQGEWLGMLVGFLTSCVVASLIAFGLRKQWRDRQRAWPRWSQMRVPRGRSRLAVTVLNSPEEVEPAETTNIEQSVETLESPSPEPGPTTSSSRT